jgi:4-diphosphocytidyl-2-C-methyl-D-erythritol kinase
MRVLRAPAKINLTLEVLGRRADGYHRLRSVMVPVALYDEITIERRGRGLQFRSNADIDAGDNLIVAALRALKLPGYDLEVTLKKRIPIAAGLGGGSSDAAAILMAAMRGVFGAPQVKDYVTLARALGSDVPFFLARTAALVEGTGERVTPLGAIPAWGCTIVRAPVAVSTAAAYEALDARPRPSRSRNDSVTVALGEELQRRNLAQVHALAQNDFEETAARAHPEIRRALAALSGWNDGFARLSGSGSCVYTIYERMPSNPLILPPGFVRFDTTFATTQDWRSESA